MATIDLAGDNTSQYHHFVPQFLLRNFAHDFEPKDCTESEAPGESRKKKKKQKNRPSLDSGKLKRYPGDKVVNNVNLLQTPYVIDESPVKRILGLTDMYRDKNGATKKEQHEVEEMFNKMENQAQRVFRKITKALADGDKVVCLPRSERDLIRKFLFLLKFRGSMFHKRFYHEAAEDYWANDKVMFRQYMRDHGFTRPIQVWLESLKTIMTLEMDPEREWMEKIKKQMYSHDANWLIMHVQKMYMAICTPSNPDDEFILTDNSYNVFEGPNHFAQDIQTGEVHGVADANFHEFAPVSPRLMIVLRHFLLPVPEEDRDPEIRELRETMRYTSVDDTFGVDTKSSLENLPIRKARNSYSKIVNGQVIRVEGEHGCYTKDDKFYFSLFPVGRYHVNKLNKILLENSSHCSRIVFGSQASFLRTLEYYMTAPKGITGCDADAIVVQLRKLDQLMKEMGSKRQSQWFQFPSPPMLSGEKHEAKFTAYHQYMKSGAEHDSSFLAIYKAFARGAGTWLKDWEQASRMQQLRIKIDSWSYQYGVDEVIRNRNRNLLLQMYMLLPPARFWLYMKRVRIMLLSPENIFITVQPLVELFNNPNFREGPEDTFSKVQTIVRRDRLNHLIYCTVKNDINMKQNPELDRWCYATSRMGALESYLITWNFALKLPGSIKDCGIHEIEKLAASMESLILSANTHKRPEFDDPRFSEDNKVELLTRVMVRRKFKKAMSARLDEGLAESLKAVLFTYTYPTPPTMDD
ncbi:hypothetical protein FOVG_14684 [Fusarium oxysporum f. sp. pisi HDV247]|uniref:DUF4238 domain-containing protein n=1 Tax=Fusarium oxysporum f. sp. pisi HDV247 TaxID=1080344 RepID=W9NU53_FUSOX|nr:hypothetical protein FOVG_14684 [Fusarium oxysporum f. sp. pisi HDV247]